MTKAHSLAASSPLDLLGGAREIPDEPVSRAEIHASIIGGIPYSALFHLTEGISVLSESDVATTLGVSTRTLRRQKETPQRAMPADLASRAWMLAETLAKASDVFGGREEAERWLSRAAMGLDGARPIDLLQTLQGAELVHEFLGRLAYGVYN